MKDVDPQAENEVLRQRLEEAEATLTAIRNGEVDALLVQGNQVYTLEGADHPYRVLVEAMQQGAVTLSPDGLVVYCNSGFARMVGRPAEQLIGAQVETFFDAADHLTLAEQLAAHTPVRQAELTLRAENGPPLPVAVSFNRLPLVGVLGICLVITDLTEHKHNQHLQASDRRKDEFLAMLAHELRNPLAPIASATQLLCMRNHGNDEQVTWACAVVDRQVKQMTRIVDDLLDISRITRGRIKLHKTPVDVTAMVAAAVETSRPLIDSRKHKLHLALAADQPRISADMTRLTQVVTNLLNNAAKYTEEGGEIWLSVECIGSEVTISVRDSGIGMTPDMLSTVFELFTQADRTIDRSQGGLGIGLTLVRSLVELHGGTVSASSKGIGRGSQFVVKLPLIVDEPKGDARQPDDPSKGRLAANPQRILVVDDNVDSARTLATLLRALGNEASVVHDGLSAIERAQALRPTLIFLDIGLPGMNGYMVAQRLREMPAMNGVVLAALTGYGEDQDRRHSMEAGFDKHFVKPITLQSLSEFLGSLPEVRPQQPAGPA